MEAAKKQQSYFSGTATKALLPPSSLEVIFFSEYFFRVLRNGRRSLKCGHNYFSTYLSARENEVFVPSPPWQSMIEA